MMRRVRTMPHRSRGKRAGSLARKTRGQTRENFPLVCHFYTPISLQMLYLGGMQTACHPKQGKGQMRGNCPPHLSISRPNQGSQVGMGRCVRYTHWDGMV